jgi:hypothetical protein
MIELVDSIECPAHTQSPIPQAILHAQAVGAYAFGNSWLTLDDYSDARPDLAAIGWILSITLSCAGRARCYDIEPGGGSNANIGRFMINADRTYGIPWLYTYASNVAAMKLAAAAQGFVWRPDGQGDYLIWSAHQGHGRHICHPDVCGYPQADGTQCGYEPENCDFSLINDYMLPPPEPVVIELPEDPDMITSVLDQNGCIHMGVAIPHKSEDPSAGATIYEIYQQDDRIHWVGGTAGKRKAAAYKLCSIPEDVG